VLGLVLLLLLTWFVLGVLLAAWTLWFQAYIYNEPVAGIYWRAPAAGAALTAFLTLWVILDYRIPGRYRELQSYSAVEYLDFPELQVVNRDGKKQVYTRRVTGRGQPEYQRNGRPLPSRPDKIIAVLDGRDYVFEPRRDAKGHFVPDRDGYLRYRNAETGWEMDETRLGQVTISHPGWRVANLLLNGLHLLVWFVCLWVLLRFQWSHALGIAVVCWAAVTLLVVPPLLNRAEDVSRLRHPPARSTGTEPVNRDSAGRLAGVLPRTSVTSRRIDCTRPA
jgi:hypothetical protein